MILWSLMCSRTKIDYKTELNVAPIWSNRGTKAVVHTCPQVPTYFENGHVTNIKK